MKKGSFLAVLISVTISWYGLFVPGVHQLVMLSWAFIALAGFIRLMPEKRTGAGEKSLLELIRNEELEKSE